MTFPNQNNNPGDTDAGAAFAGFGKFVPGFDFLQNLVTQAGASAANHPAAAPAIPGLAGWIAPTLNVEDLERRIKELKTVQFWLDQNATALKATITALEVQKMTLSTLKGMNFNMTDMAKVFTASLSGNASTPAPEPRDKAKTFAGLETPPTVFGSAASPANEPPAPTPAGPAPTAGVDPMQWWGALTQQFQSIASNAMQDVAAQAAKHPAPGLAAGLSEGSTQLAEQTAAALARAQAGLAGGVAVLGKTLGQQAWPSLGVADGSARVAKKTLVKAATSAPKKALAVARKPAAPVAAKSARTASKSAAKPQAGATKRKVTR